MDQAGITKMAESVATGNTTEPAAQVDDGTMEDILEKLKLLNYQISFCQTWPTSKGHNFRSLTRTYFCVPASNLNEQYFYFASVVAWLVGLCGGKIDTPDQFEDPNVVSTNIIQAVKELDMPVRVCFFFSRIEEGSQQRKASPHPLTHHRRTSCPAKSVRALETLCCSRCRCCATRR